mmetsp:Transcript_85588/g.228190  ORF Transcript_85588/g.228190 Transcript_85588/m.228190 type:complete len:488 (+) Transcript_85588:1061-2524(+)
MLRDGRAGPPRFGCLQREQHVVGAQLGCQEGPLQAWPPLRGCGVSYKEARPHTRVPRVPMLDPRGFPQRAPTLPWLARGVGRPIPRASAGQAADGRWHRHAAPAPGRRERHLLAGAHGGCAPAQGERTPPRIPRHWRRPAARVRGPQRRGGGDGGGGAHELGPAGGRLRGLVDGPGAHAGGRHGAHVAGPHPRGGHGQDHARGPQRGDSAGLAPPAALLPRGRAGPWGRGGLLGGDAQGDGALPRAAPGPGEPGAAGGGVGAPGATGHSAGGVHARRVAAAVPAGRQGPARHRHLRHAPLPRARRRPPARGAVRAGRLGAADGAGHPRGHRRDVGPRLLGLRGQQPAAGDVRHGVGGQHVGPPHVQGRVGGHPGGQGDIRQCAARDPLRGQAAGDGQGEGHAAGDLRAAGRAGPERDPRGGAVAGGAGVPGVGGVAGRRGAAGGAVGGGGAGPPDGEPGGDPEPEAGRPAVGERGRLAAHFVRIGGD